MVTLVLSISYLDTFFSFNFNLATKPFPGLPYLHPCLSLLFPLYPNLFLEFLREVSFSFVSLHSTNPEHKLNVKL